MVSNKEAEDLLQQYIKDNEIAAIDPDWHDGVIRLMKQASAIAEARAGQKNKSRGIELAINKLARRRDDLLQDDTVKAKLFDMTGKDDDEIEANMMQRAIEVIKSP